MEESIPIVFESEENPIPELIDTEAYLRLKRDGLLDATGLRNYCIKRLYRYYRREGMSMFDSLQKLADDYGLSYDYLRKMVGISRVYVRKERKIIQANQPREISIHKK